jgi:ornithine cyclodeaminase/alanine dehydrogenase-like protein (mu-crystallin family)
LLDSLAVTIVRTAAVTAVATSHLARPDARSALVIGAGTQAPLQVAALRLARPMEHIAIYDIVPEKAEALAENTRGQGVRASVVDDPGRAAQSADVIVTVTPAKDPVLTRPPRGATILALGADGPGKRELGPEVLAESKVVVDVLEQAALAGELASALRDGIMTRNDVHAELGDVIAGTTPGRTDPNETIVFDGTGTALQDVTAAMLIIEAARRAGRGVEANLTD